jgi:hypothetical protein
MCFVSNVQILAFIQCPSCCNVNFSQVASKRTMLWWCQIHHSNAVTLTFNLWFCVFVWHAWLLKFLFYFLNFVKHFFPVKVCTTCLQLCWIHVTKACNICKNSLVRNVFKWWCIIMIGSSFFHSSWWRFHNFSFHIVIIHMSKSKNIWCLFIWWLSFKWRGNTCLIGEGAFIV